LVKLKKINSADQFSTQRIPSTEGSLIVVSPKEIDSILPNKYEQRCCAVASRTFSGFHPTTVFAFSPN
jgi:hypothetical protein